MKTTRNIFILFVMVITLGIAHGASYGLDILLTNDDGWEMAPGVPNPVQALYGALLGAGHSVTCVVPAENQSGTGGSLNTGVGDVVAISPPDETYPVYRVPSTPTDCVRAALGVLGVTPDIIISGPNFGQNIGMQASSGSGTINAAILGAQQGIPAIAVSLGLNLAEYPSFGSTFASYGSTAAFVVNLINTLDEKARYGGLLPDGTLLNVNIPVPYMSIEGIEITNLAQESALDFVWVPAGSGSGMILTKAQLGGIPEEIGSDQYAYDNNKISISVLDSDMTANFRANFSIRIKLKALEP